MPHNEGHSPSAESVSENGIVVVQLPIRCDEPFWLERVRIRIDVLVVRHGPERTRVRTGIQGALALDRRAKYFR
jgi:hypothetical protein